MEPISTALVIKAAIAAITTALAIAAVAYVGWKVFYAFVEKAVNQNLARKMHKFDSQVEEIVATAKKFYDDNEWAIKIIVKGVDQNGNEAKLDKGIVSMDSAPYDVQERLNNGEKIKEIFTVEYRYS
ncbi:MAG: hypothetical protein U7127_24160 [Phormidium sp.]